MTAKLLNTGLYFAIVGMLSAVMLPGCTRERNTQGLTDEGVINVRLEVQLPADLNSATGTRGMSSDEEAAVATVDVYHFVDYNENGKYLGVSAAPIQGTFTPGPPSWINTTLETYPGKNSRLVFVVNARNNSNYGYYRQIVLEDFLASMIMEQPDEWNSASGSSTPLPMYGITGDVEIKKDIPNNILDDNGDPFPLIRTHAKFNVSLKENFSDPFELKSLCIFNRPTHGFIPYNENSWNASDPTAPYVTAPHIPSSISYVYEPVTQFTVGTDSSKEDYGKILNKQYVLEVDNTAQSNRLKKTALVVGGVYGSDTETTYYRIDIDVTDGNILRNHLYDVEIQSVAGSGAPTPKEAYEGTPELSAYITPWNLTDYSTVMEGQYHLTIEHDVIVATSEPKTMAVYVWTDHPSGLYMSDSEITTDPADTYGWLFTMGNINKLQSGTITIYVSRNESGAERSAKIYIHAGNLTKVFNIYQEG